MARGYGSLEAHGGALGGSEGNVGHVVGIVAADEWEQVKDNVCGEEETDGEGDIGTVGDERDDGVNGGARACQWGQTGTGQGVGHTRRIQGALRAQ